MKLQRHYYKAKLKNWKWNPKTNDIDEYYEEVEKDFNPSQLKRNLILDKFALFGYFLLGLFAGSLGFFFNWMVGLISVLAMGVVAFFVALVIYWDNHYHTCYSYDLGEQDDFMESSNLSSIFAEEIELRLHNKEHQEKLALKWRKNHPLEEKIRLALTKNPNHIADLLRYCELVKSHSELKEHISFNMGKNESNSGGITVKYINSTNNSKKRKKNIK